MNGEWVGAVDGASDSSGYYRLGPIPGDTFAVQAEAPIGSDYNSQVFDHVATRVEATGVSILIESTVFGIDFDLGSVSNAPGLDPYGATIIFRDTDVEPVSRR